MLNYWLNKLFYDLHCDRALAAEYRGDREGVLARYPLKDTVLEAVRDDDVAAIGRLTNPFLMRYYFIASGMPERAFLDRLQAQRRPMAESAAHG